MISFLSPIEDIDERPTTPFRGFILPFAPPNYFLCCGLTLDFNWPNYFAFLGETLCLTAGSTPTDPFRF